MNSKIEKSFQNSQFYRNYNNIDTVILKFEKIKNGYTESKNKYKNNLISIVNALNKNQINQKIIKILNDKYEFINFKNDTNVSIRNEKNIDKHKLNSCRSILNEKINISHNIKKYFIYSENIDDIFIKSVEVGNIKNIKKIKNIKFLIEKGANIHKHNDYVLRSFSVCGNIEVVKYLVEKGADIRADNDYALRFSSHYGHIEVVKFLVDKGADIHAIDDYAFRMSSYNKHIEVVKYLVEKGADIHACDNYALRWSSHYGHIEVVKFLVENGADIHVYDDHALRWSSHYGHIEIVKFLINFDLEYFSKNEIAKNMVIEHNLIEFYEKFDIK